MKKIYPLLLLFIGWNASAQNILFVNDNDALPQNTDSLIVAMSSTIYSVYDFWDIPDSADVGPSFDFMNNYDLVIWYCSTDGGGLNLWDGTAAGNSAIIEYILTEKPLWIIGLDMLFEIHATPPDALISGDFAYDYMGISSYNVQSYGDDGSTGLPQADTATGAPSVFPDSLIWDYATQWWVDGVTPRTDVISIYEMGPSSYTLAGEVCMLHNTQDLNNVMTTLFDPALIKGVTATANFMETTITYLLPADLGIISARPSNFKIYPNPIENELYIEFSGKGTYEIFDISGKQIRSGALINQITAINLSNLEVGTYFIQISESNGSISNQKFIKK